MVPTWRHSLGKNFTLNFVIITINRSKKVSIVKITLEYIFINDVHTIIKFRDNSKVGYPVRRLSDISLTRFPEKFLCYALFRVINETIWH